MAATHSDWDRLTGLVGIPGPAGPSLTAAQRQEVLGSLAQLRETLRVANYLEVASIAHAKGLACFSGDNALRPLGDSPYCCGQELMAEFDESWVFAGNLTAQAWRGRRITAAACGNDDVPGNALTSCGLSQDSARRLQMNHMMLPELMAEWARSDFRMQGILPYAMKVEPGVWEQTGEWLKFCQGVRRPLRKP